MKSLPYELDDLLEDEKLLEAAALLTGRSDVERVDIRRCGGDGFLLSRGYPANAMIGFSDGSSYGALLKGAWEGALREGTGMEAAALLGPPLYDFVAGEDFLLLEKAEGTDAETAKRTKRWRESIGREMPRLKFLGYSDIVPRHFLLGKKGKVTPVDWGTVFIYAPGDFSEFWWLEELAAVPSGDGGLYARGERAGKAAVLEAYCTHDARQRIYELLEPLDRPRYEDCWVGYSSRDSDPFPRNGRELVRRAKHSMESFAKEWEKELR